MADRQRHHLWSDFSLSELERRHFHSGRNIRLYYTDHSTAYRNRHSECYLHFIRYSELQRRYRHSQRDGEQSHSGCCLADRQRHHLWSDFSLFELERRHFHSGRNIRLYYTDHSIGRRNRNSKC